MLYPTTPDDLRRRRLIVAGVATALLLIAFVTYAVLVHRSHSRPSCAADQGAGTGRAAPTTHEVPAVTELPTLRPTSDPETFARAGRRGDLRVGHRHARLTRDRPHRATRRGRRPDRRVDARPGVRPRQLPADAGRLGRARRSTRPASGSPSTRCTTPTKWAEAEAQAGDELLPGTTALTIHGTRHRSGIWEGEPVSSEHDVAFTVFIVCGPSYPECHLLRLSMLDKPLD